MRHRPLLILVLATPLGMAGCMRQMASNDLHPSFSAVSVRFAMPTDLPGTSTADAQTMMRDGALFDGAISAALAAQKNAAPNRDFHIALWGGAFHGCDVTNTVATLTPGSYTFALFDQNNSSFVQGWAEVNGTGIGTLDMLLRWRDRIREERQMFAYGMELQRHTPQRDEVALSELTDATRAFDRLESRISRAIDDETKTQASRRRSLNEFLASTEVLMLPTERPTFHSATKAAFNDKDLTMVRSGNAVSKFVLLADRGTAQRKLRQVNQLYRELTHARAVQSQIVERLERRKGRFLMTDHLFHDDVGFIANETNLQNTLAVVERMDQRMADLRDRRMALAFVSELITNDGAFTTLEQERHELLRERAGFEARKNRFDLMFEESGETSPTRVALEGSRQRVAASLEMMDRQIAQLDEAWGAIGRLAQATEVIHRQGDKRLLTTTYIGQDMPFRVRDIIEREALMTLRLEPSTSVFAPRPTDLTAMGRASSACPGNTSSPEPAGRPTSQPQATTSMYTASVDPVYQDSVYGASIYDGTFASQDGDCLDVPDWMIVDDPGPAAWPTTITEATQPEPQPGTSARPVAFSGENRSPQPKAQLARSPATGSARTPVAQKKAQDGDCPFLIKLLVPPCWISQRIRQDRRATAPDGSAEAASRPSDDAP